MDCDCHFVRVVNEPLFPIDIAVNDISYVTYGTRKNPDTNLDERTAYVYFKSNRYILLTGKYVDDFEHKTRKYVS